MEADRRPAPHSPLALAALFAGWNAKLKKEHPGLTTTSVFMQPVQRSNIWGDGVPFDLLGMIGKGRSY